jgi:hypothetical protein
MLLVEALGLELECGNRSKIRTEIESLLFCCYSNLADRQIPNPWPTTGTQCTRPIYSRTQTHTAKYLRSIGAQGTQYRQDAWPDPKDHENRKPGAMFNGDGMMEGHRKGPLPTMDSDMIYSGRAEDD